MMIRGSCQAWTVCQNYKRYHQPLSWYSFHLNQYWYINEGLPYHEILKCYKLDGLILVIR
jgi:hypothetical protein